MNQPILCPICDASMHLVRPKNGAKWKAFYGCDDYPECEGSRSIGKTGEVQADDEAIAEYEFRQDWTDSFYDELHLGN